MELKEFAQILNNRQYACPQFSKDELQIAKDNDFVIVFGASDDLMEFEGAIEDEIGCYEGKEVWVGNRTTYGLVSQDCRCIEALWCDNDARDENGNVITWTYKTDIPHETFMIFEDDEPYCRGIVFKLEDV